MIKNIRHLKEFGIFRNYSNAETEDFVRYNLIYGWNGSGKSTLSRVFRCIENKSSSGEFPSAEFTLERVDDTSITHKNIATIDHNICTFNEEFVTENISWNDIAKSILLIDKSKISERKLFDENVSQQKLDEEKFKTRLEDIGKIATKNANFCKKGASQIKKHFGAIDTTDSYFMNFNKTKFEALIEKNTGDIKDGSAILNTLDVDQLTKSANPNQKPELKQLPPPINTGSFPEAASRLSDLLETSILNKAIKRLTEKPDIGSWVGDGTRLHETHNSTECEFCGSLLTDTRKEQLEAHFNAEYRAFKDRLNKAAQWLFDQKIKLPELPATSDLYDEFSVHFLAVRERLGDSIIDVNSAIGRWQEILAKKVKDPLNIELKIDPIDSTIIKAYNDSVATVNELIFKHNEKTKDFEAETRKAKDRLALHLAAEEVLDFAYFEKLNEIEQKKNNNNDLKKRIDKRAVDIEKLESSLSNEGLGATEFNKSLHRFLGRTDLSLRFNSQKRGYEIIRNNRDNCKGKLSEGEKTAIAFVYFITKLKERDNSLAETTIVIDDPVSSFDSTHLFNAFSFLKAHCENAKQLFVLTHNFTFFMLIRRWILNKNRKKPNSSKLYSIEATNEEPRAAKLGNAGKALHNHNSEYHYVFARLYKLRGKNALDTDDHFLAANLGRKVIETFLSFKFPKQSGSLAGVLHEAIKNAPNFNNVDEHQIYRFINRYSHGESIDENDDSAEIFLGECATVINKVFNLIEELDSAHYEGMLSAA